MATDRFDQTARFPARFDPEGILAWLFPGFAAHLRFERWLDTRTALGKRFAAVPPDVLRRIDATTDLGILNRAVEQVLDVARAEDLPL